MEMTTKGWKGRNAPLQHTYFGLTLGLPSLTLISMPPFLPEVLLWIVHNL